MKQLDTLRAIAVAMVIYTHWVPGPKPFWFSGNLGVQIFFVISGFLITGILLKAREQAEQLDLPQTFVLRRFYVRRFLRIFPLFYATLFVTATLGFAVVRDHFVWHFFYLSNVYFALQGEWLGQASHFWSLCIEEQFYLAWPVFILFAPKRILRPFILLTIGSALVFRLMGESLLGLTPFAIGVLPFSSLDTLGIGALLAWAHAKENKAHERPSRVIPYLNYICIASVVVYTILKIAGPVGGWSHVSVLLREIAFAPALLYLVWSAAVGIRGPIKVVLEWPPFLFVGKISYGLYLLHNFVPTITKKAFDYIGYPLVESHGLLTMQIINLTMLLLLCAGSWYLFESRVNGFKRFFPYVTKPEIQLKLTQPAGFDTAKNINRRSA